MRSVENDKEEATGVLGSYIEREALENLSLTGKIAGSRGRGKPRIKYMHVIKKTIPGQCSTGEILQMNRHRK